ncbi:hypothetical protein CDAR_589281 [Caerostris darwini]|uniref:Uncharacterized protein n=1 Tax=Caerostris darwini TaxID=1538125 RepID=A0AAV4TDX0_9ARAC|nr:hypothetical protein CDAR_589281 [Caerostris darwini]
MSPDGSLPSLKTYRVLLKWCRFLDEGVGVVRRSGGRRSRPSLPPASSHSNEVRVLSNPFGAPISSRPQPFFTYPQS